MARVAVVLITVYFCYLASYFFDSRPLTPPIQELISKSKSLKCQKLFIVHPLMDKDGCLQINDSDCVCTFTFLTSYSHSELSLYSDYSVLCNDGCYIYADSRLFTYLYLFFVTVFLLILIIPVIIIKCLFFKNSEYQNIN